MHEKVKVITHPGVSIGLQAGSSCWVNLESKTENQNATDYRIMKKQCGSYIKKIKQAISFSKVSVKRHSSAQPNAL